MKEILNRFPIGEDLLRLTDQELASTLLGIVIARAEGNGSTAPQFLSRVELENIYGVSLALPAHRRKHVNDRLAAAYQQLLSENYTMPAPGQPSDVITISPSGRAGLKPVKKSLREWAGADGRLTLAIVFTDIVGSTALTRELGDALMSEVLYRHFAQSKFLLSKHAGFEVKTTGDGVLALFRSVDAAFQFARTFQSEPGSSEIQMRAGIHIGPVDATGEDVSGAAVNFARRIEEAIPGAEIWLSTRAKEDLDAAVSREAEWQSHDVELKDFGHYQLWSLEAEPTGDIESPGTKAPLPHKSRRAEAACRYLAPELARVLRQQIYILDRAVANFVTASVGQMPPGDRWTSLKPAQPTPYPPELANLDAEDAIRLNEFYSLVREIADMIEDLIQTDPPPPLVNTWNVLMQEARNSLEAGKFAVQHICPDRQYDATLPVGGTLIGGIEKAVSSVQPALDAHLARHAGSAIAATPRVRRPLSLTRPPNRSRGPNSWMAK